MTDKHDEERKAIELARQALALLDACGAGDTLFACHLSHALDAADQHPDAPSPADSADPSIRSSGLEPVERHSGRGNV